MKNLIKTLEMQTGLKTYVLLLVLIFLVGQVSAATRTTVQSGNWNSPSTWDCDCVPGNNDNVVINHGNTVTLDKHIRVRSLAIRSLGTLDVTSSNYNIKITRDWINDGVFLYHEGKVAFRGQTSQVIGGGLPTTFWNLQIKKNQGELTLTSPIHVEFRLRLKKGIVYTDDVNYITIGPNGKANSASDASYINGPMKIQTEDIKSIVFNTGKDGKHKKVAIDVASSDPSAFMAEFIYNQGTNVACAPGISHVTSSDAWKIDQTAGTASGEVELFWDVSNGDSSPIHTMSTAKVARFCSTQTLWLDAGNNGISGNTIAGNIYSADMSEYGTFTFACSDMNCPEHNGTNKTDGSNASQGGVAQIEVEAPAETAAAPTKEDEDFHATAMDVFPNPVQGDEVNIKIQGHDGAEVLVVVVDMLGTEHYSKVAIEENGHHIVGIDLGNHLSPGIYMVIGSSQNNVYKKQLMIK